ncbi:efflux RND transporter periplasmic adaptor subunit [Aquabacterium sp. A3]|uniref:efflux RND transporter periplasmic adaptor subunit n=1 Tax=Aquabacterium sp. A3 TaxID=3132829 RepID=UPI003119EA79
MALRHPRSFFHRRLTWLGLGALGLVALAWLMTDREARATSGERKSAPAVVVRVAEVVQDDVSIDVQAVGMVQASAQAIVRARVAGQLQAVKFQEGARVRTGQVLAQLDDREARAELARWSATVDQLAAQWRQARDDLQRYEDLARQSAISVQQRDQQASQASQLEAQWRAAQASRDAARVQLEHTVVRAPLDGRAGLRQVDAGNLVGPADEQGLVTITRLDPIHVVFAVPQARWADVREALQARPDTPVTLLESAPLAPQGARQPLQGKVLTRDNQIDPASGTLKLKAAFANGDDRLLPGQAVSVRLPVRQLAGALVLPATAVQAGLRGDMVWRLTPASPASPAQVEPVWIEVIWRDEQRVAIKSGLASGDRVVVDGHARLKPGASVRVLPAADAGEAG